MTIRGVDLAGLVGDDMVIGVTADGTRHIAGADGVYRIASLSKVLTGLVAADAARRGEIGLDDVAVTIGGAPVSFRHLATHTSGIAGAKGWYGDVDTADDFIDGFATVEPASPPGAEWAYSNFGMSLLAALIARRVGVGYAELVRSRVTGPLGMDDTVLQLSPAQAARLRPGHDADGTPVTTPTLPTFAGSGGFHGTAGDLLTLLDAHLAAAPGSAFADAVAPHADRPGGAMGLGWIIDPGLTWHNGSLPGFRSFAGFVPGKDLGIVILTNTSRPVDELARRVLGELA